MQKNNKGYVYILTNPSFKNDWIKIGKSSRPVNIRSKELDNTAIPLPFEIYATLKTSKYEMIERKIHKQIDRLTDLRIRNGREFFNIKPEIAYEILEDEANTLNDAELGLYKNIKLKKLKNSKSKSYEGNNEIYFLNSKGLQGKLKYTEKGFKVFKGTTANLIDTNAMPWVKLKKELVNNGILVKKGNLFEFSKDYIFPAPSAASAIILGRNSNGWTEWKTKDGRMLDELRKK